jgi:teichuronic acid biosynthesis glycosyltransferase TuaC
MRILTFTSLFPSAKRPLFGIFVFQRVSHVAKCSGNTVQVVAPVPYFPSWVRSKRWGVYGQIPSEESIENLEVHHPRYPLLSGFLMSLHGFLMFLGAFPTVRRLHRQYDFDCIDAHYVYPDGFAAVLLGKVLHIPVVVSARGTDINVFPSFWTIRPMIRWTLRHAMGVIAVADALRKAIMDLGVTSEKIVVIPNGVEVNQFRPVPRREARRKLGLPENSKIAVCVASLTESKNHRLLISALSQIPMSNPETQLYILGEGPLRDELNYLVHQLSLDRRVFLLGARPNQELALWFSAADVSCLVSSREGWPNVVMESIACGTPVVATRAGGIPEIITTPELGILVDPDSNSIAAGLQSALSKEWNRSLLVQRAQSRTWDHVAKEVDAYLSCRVSGRAR